MAKSSLTLEQFKSLCNFDSKTGKWVQKSGKAYIDALSTIFNLVNKNDKPFTVEDIKQQPTKEKFKFAGVKDYTYICDLSVSPLEITNTSRKNEKIIASNFTEKGKKIFDKSNGVSYMLTCAVGNQEYIIKIGQTRTPFSKRLQSYNCGVVNNWRTASTTNVKMLQSMVTSRQVFKLYICDCSADQYSITWHGVKSINFASPKSLAIEDIMVKEFIKQFNKKPLANIQANATEN